MIINLAEILDIITTTQRKRYNTLNSRELKQDNLSRNYIIHHGKQKPQTVLGIINTILQQEGQKKTLLKDNMATKGYPQSVNTIITHTNRARSFKQQVTVPSQSQQRFGALPNPLFPDYYENWGDPTLLSEVHLSIERLLKIIICVSPFRHFTTFPLFFYQLAFLYLGLAGSLACFMKNCITDCFIFLLAFPNVSVFSNGFGSSSQASINCQGRVSLLFAGAKLLCMMYNEAKHKILSLVFVAIRDSQQRNSFKKNKMSMLITVFITTCYNLLFLRQLYEGRLL